MVFTAGVINHRSAVIPVSTKMKFRKELWRKIMFDLGQIHIGKGIYVLKLTI